MPPSISQNPLSTLRKLLFQQTPALDAYIIPSSDEYLNEYIPAHLNRREWLTGFTGSAGDALITQDAAYVFVDGRYHEQVDTEIDASQWTAVKVGQKEALTLLKTLKKLAGEGHIHTVGYPAACTRTQQIQSYIDALSPFGVQFVSTETHWVDTVWPSDDRPEPTLNPIITLPDSVTGQPIFEKLTAIREKMTEAGCAILPVNMLDQIAWLFNLRGDDIPYNPVFLSYAILTHDEALLFLPEERLPLSCDTLTNALSNAGVRILPLCGYATELARMCGQQAIWGDKDCLTAQTWEILQAEARAIYTDTSPLTTLKAIKNQTELAGMREAHVQAGLAWVKAMYWLHQQVQNDHAVSEKDFAEELLRQYRDRPGFVSLSFNTIAGMGEHGAIIHYSTPSRQRFWQDGELFLVDSGAQFATATWAGTTDTTRTWLKGAPTDEQRLAYTHVLQAHIAGTRQPFPAGTTGAQLDGIVRRAMWQAGLDFMHGTGHGVGAFLNVHEGPCGISKGYNTALKPGMLVSMEPGYYQPGAFGIRLENVVEVVELEQSVSTTGEAMLGFQSLTVLPFDTQLIEISQLPKAHQQWLDRYHQRVKDTLIPHLGTKEQEFLAGLCNLPSTS